MPVSKAIVLYYAAGDEAQIAHAKGVFIRSGVRIRMVDASQLGQAVGSFAGVEVPQPEVQDHPPVEESMMVFINMAMPKLYAVLTALDKAGVPRSVLKSVLAAENARWSFYQLYDELKKEREGMESKPQ